MDVKDLNKPQLILLTLLLSFVASIATSIATVSLMQQAPPSIIQPINRVVQQTVEKIVPSAGNPTVQTVVVKEEDLVVDALAKNQPSVFTITEGTTDASGNAVEVPAGHGFVISNDGTVVADAALVPDKEVYFVTNASGKFKASFVSTDPGGFSFLKIGDPVNGTDKLAFTVPTFGDLTTMKAGQKIIVLANSVNSFIYNGSGDLSMTVSKSNAGGEVMDLDGNVIGIALSGDTISFAPMSAINKALKSASTTTSASTDSTAGSSTTQ